MVSSNIVPLNSRLTIKAYAQDNQLVVLLIGGSHAESVKYVKFKSLSPRASIKNETIGERSIYRLIIRNFDLNGEDPEVVDIVNVQLPSEEQALLALNSFYESLAESLQKQRLEAIPVTINSKLVSDKKTVMASTILAIFSAIIVSGSVLNFGLNKVDASAPHQFDAALTESSIKEQRVAQRQSTVISVSHRPEVKDPYLEAQAVKNIEVLGRFSGFDLWDNRKDGTPLWVFVTPGTEETATLLNRIDNMPRISGMTVRPIIIPVVTSESQIKNTISTICVDGKSDPIINVPTAWRNASMPTEDSPSEQCIGGLNRLRLAAQTFEHMGFIKAPVMVASSGAVTAFANASSEEIASWVGRVQ